jgi:hypothetical protein
MRREASVDELETLSGRAGNDGNSLVCHDVIEKIRCYRTDEIFAHDLDQNSFIEKKGVRGSRLALGRNAGGGPPKFGGMSHDVIEKKWRKKFIQRKSNDVYENKGVRYF